MNSLSLSCPIRQRESNKIQGQFQEHLSHAGRTTVVELIQGDITNNLPPNWNVDLLLVSAFPNNYDETYASVIGALARNQGIHVYRLARNKDEDLRDSLECWISKPLEQYYYDNNDGSGTKRYPYKRIMVWEPGYHNSIMEKVESIFAAIIAMASTTKTLAMPILGAGDRGSHKNQMLEAILYAIQKWVIHRGLPIERIQIFMYSIDDAVIQQFQITKH